VNTTRDLGAARWLVLAIVSTAQFLCVLDAWVVNVALPALQRDFASTTLSSDAWILNVYTILLAALLVPAGRLADSFGRRRFFLAGLALFGSASLGCALAPTLPVLIAWRALQAVGAAILLPTSLGLALPAFAPSERGTAVAVWAAVGALAAGVGPVLGGVLVEWSWRWIFLINLPLILAALLVGAIVLPRDGARVQQRVDAVGTLLVLGAIGLVCAGLIQAPTWPAIATWSVLGIGLLLVAMFVVHTLRHPSPLVPPALFRMRRFSVSAVGLLTYYVGFSAILLGTTLLLTQRWHLSVLETAVAIAPGPITAGIISPFSGRIAARIGARRTILVGAVLFGMAAAWPLLRDSPVYLAMILPSMLLWGAANALIQPTLLAAANSVPRTDLTSGAAVLAMARQVGAALGVALLVVALSTGGGTELVGFQHAWALVIASAVITGVAGVFAEPIRRPAGIGDGRYTDPDPRGVRREPVPTQS
jgi:EmrB/QacA subfamily drug resistance transporter